MTISKRSDMVLIAAELIEKIGGEEGFQKK
jgi:hypothetical protein